MPPPLLTHPGLTKEQAAQNKLDGRAANPITWLKDMIDEVKLHPIVKAHTDQLFKGKDKYLGVDLEASWPTAMRIACRINWARAQHALLSCEPSSPKHFALSKIASMWAINEAKFKGLNRSQGGKLKRRIDLEPPPTNEDG